jgi:hypothetical protein
MLQAGTPASCRRFSLRTIRTWQRPDRGGVPVPADLTRPGPGARPAGAIATLTLAITTGG